MLFFDEQRLGADRNFGKTGHKMDVARWPVVLSLKVTNLAVAFKRKASTCQKIFGHNFGIGKKWHTPRRDKQTNTQ